MNGSPEKFQSPPHDIKPEKIVHFKTHLSHSEEVMISDEDRGMASKWINLSIESNDRRLEEFANFEEKITYINDAVQQVDVENNEKFRKLSNIVVVTGAKYKDFDLLHSKSWHALNQTSIFEDGALIEPEDDERIANFIIVLLKE